MANILFNIELQHVNQIFLRNIYFKNRSKAFKLLLFLKNIYNIYYKLNTLRHVILFVRTV